MIPAQLPAAVYGFAGREREIARLDAVAAETQERGATMVICAVSGTAGVGKTALAVHWAHRAADRFPDGQLYVNLRGFEPSGSVLSPADAIRGFLDGLGVPATRIPADLTGQAALYRSVLAGKRILVVLDNARDAEQVRPLLPGSPGCAVVVTSRNQLSGLVVLDGAELVVLDVLSRDEARELLAQRLDRVRVAGEPAAVEEIIDRCARLPLALAVVAARAAVGPSIPLAALAEELGEAEGRLDSLSAGDAAADVRAVFSWSYRTLRPDAAALFRMLGVHPGPDITPAAAASLAGTSVEAATAGLDELTRAQLLSRYRLGRYGFHDLLRAYAVERALAEDPEESRHAATARMLGHYLHSADAANRQLNLTRDPVTLAELPTGVIPETVADPAAALDWYTVEYPVLLAMVEHAAVTGFDTHAWQLAWNLAIYQHRRRDAHGLAATQRTAVAAAKRLGDPAVQVRAHRTLGNAYTMLSRLEDAEEQFHEALALAARIGDVTAQALTHHSLTVMRESQGRYAEALEHAEQCFDLYRAAGHRAGEATALNAMGWYHALLGQYEQAIEPCTRALARHEESGDRHGQAAAWDSLGYAHHHLSRYDEAVRCYQRALDVLHDLGDRYRYAMILVHLGDTYHATGNPAAQSAYEQAIAILDELQHPDATSVRSRLAPAD